MASEKFSGSIVVQKNACRFAALNKEHDRLLLLVGCILSLARAGWVALCTHCVFQCPLKHLSAASCRCCSIDCSQDFSPESHGFFELFGEVAEYLVVSGLQLLVLLISWVFPQWYAQQRTFLIGSLRLMEPARIWWWFLFSGDAPWSMLGGATWTWGLAPLFWRSVVYLVPFQTHVAISLADHTLLFVVMTLANRQNLSLNLVRRMLAANLIAGGVATVLVRCLHSSWAECDAYTKQTSCWHGPKQSTKAQQLEVGASDKSWSAEPSTSSSTWACNTSTHWTAESISSCHTFSDGESSWNSWEVLDFNSLHEPVTEEFVCGGHNASDAQQDVWPSAYSTAVGGGLCPDSNLVDGPNTAAPATTTYGYEPASASHAGIEAGTACFERTPQLDEALHSSAQLNILDAAQLNAREIAGDLLQELQLEEAGSECTVAAAVPHLQSQPDLLDSGIHVPGVSCGDSQASATSAGIDAAAASAWVDALLAEDWSCVSTADFQASANLMMSVCTPAASSPLQPGDAAPDVKYKSAADWSWLVAQFATPSSTASAPSAHDSDVTQVQQFPDASNPSLFSSPVVPVPSTPTHAAMQDEASAADPGVWSSLTSACQLSAAADSSLSPPGADPVAIGLPLPVVSMTSNSSSAASSLSAEPMLGISFLASSASSASSADDGTVQQHAVDVFSTVAEEDASFEVADSASAAPSSAMPAFDAIGAVLDKLLQAPAITNAPLDVPGSTMWRSPDLDDDALCSIDDLILSPPHSSSSACFSAPVPSASPLLPSTPRVARAQQSHSTQRSASRAIDCGAHKCRRPAHALALTTECIMPRHAHCSTPCWRRCPILEQTSSSRTQQSSRGSAGIQVCSGVHMDSAFPLPLLQTWWISKPAQHSCLPSAVDRPCSSGIKPLLQGLPSTGADLCAELLILTAAAPDDATTFRLEHAVSARAGLLLPEAALTMAGLVPGLQLCSVGDAPIVDTWLLHLQACQHASTTVLYQSGLDTTLVSIQVEQPLPKGSQTAGQITDLSQHCLWAVPASCTLCWAQPICVHAQGQILLLLHHAKFHSQVLPAVPVAVGPAGCDPYSPSASSCHSTLTDTMHSSDCDSIPALERGSSSDSSSSLVNSSSNCSTTGSFLMPVTEPSQGLEQALQQHLGLGLQHATCCPSRHMSMLQPSLHSTLVAGSAESAAAACNSSTAGHGLATRRAAHAAEAGCPSAVWVWPPALPAGRAAVLEIGLCRDAGDGQQLWLPKALDTVHGVDTAGPAYVRVLLSTGGAVIMDVELMLDAGQRICRAGIPALHCCSYVDVWVMSPGEGPSHIYGCTPVLVFGSQAGCTEIMHLYSAMSLEHELSSAKQTSTSQPPSATDDAAAAAAPTATIQLTSPTMRPAGAGCKHVWVHHFVGLLRDLAACMTPSVAALGCDQLRVLARMDLAAMETLVHSLLQLLIQHRMPTVLRVLLSFMRYHAPAVLFRLGFRPDGGLLLPSCLPSTGCPQAARGQHGIGCA